MFLAQIGLQDVHFVAKCFAKQSQDKRKFEGDYVSWT